jgi:hypothetical protein
MLVVGEVERHGGVHDLWRIGRIAAAPFKQSQIRFNPI